MGWVVILCFMIDDHIIHIEYHKIIQIVQKSLNSADKKITRSMGNSITNSFPLEFTIKASKHDFSGLDTEYIEM